MNKFKINVNKSPFKVLKMIIQSLFPTASVSMVVFIIVLGSSESNDYGIEEGTFGNSLANWILLLANANCSPWHFCPLWCNNSQAHQAYIFKTITLKKKKIKQWPNKVEPTCLLHILQVLSSAWSFTLWKSYIFLSDSVFEIQIHTTKIALLENLFKFVMLKHMK